MFQSCKLPVCGRCRHGPTRRMLPSPVSGEPKPDGRMPRGAAPSASGPQPATQQPSSSGLLRRFSATPPSFRRKASCQIAVADRRHSIAYISITHFQRTYCICRAAPSLHGDGGLFHTVLYRPAFVRLSPLPNPPYPGPASRGEALHRRTAKAAFRKII